MEMPVPELPADVRTVLFHQQLGSGAQRIGDAERSATCDVLSAHFAAGRLTGDEFDQRVALALRSMTLAELWQLTADLPLASVAVRNPQADHKPPDQKLVASPWGPVLTVLATLALIGSGLLAAAMLVMLDQMLPGHFKVALVGGVAAAVAGASLCYLIVRRPR